MSVIGHALAGEFPRKTPLHKLSISSLDIEAALSSASGLM